MRSKTIAVLAFCIVLTGCSLSVEVTDSSEVTAESQTAEVQTQVQPDDDGGYAGSQTAAFLARIDKHDFSMKLRSQQSGGNEVIEEIEVCGDVMLDAYKDSEGKLTAEMYIVGGNIWSVISEGSDKPVCIGKDEYFNEHVRESVFHCLFVDDADKFGGADGDTERIYGNSESMEYLFTYGEGGQLKSYEANGIHYEVMEYVEGIGEVTLPDALKSEIEKGQQ